MSDLIKKHVLIIEDSPDLQMLLGKLFRKNGYELSQAYNGEEALTMLKASPSKPALILLDIMMPVMDGFQFREKQLADPTLSQIPVILMSADSQAEAKASQMQIPYIFKKPIQDLKAFVAVADRLISEKFVLERHRNETNWSDFSFADHKGLCVIDDFEGIAKRDSKKFVSELQLKLVGTDPKKL